MAAEKKKSEGSKLSKLPIGTTMILFGTAVLLFGAMMIVCGIGYVVHRTLLILAQLGPLLKPFLGG